MPTTRAALERRGFIGFVTFEQLSSSDIPLHAGVYAILRCSDQPVSFLPTSPAGIINGRTPTVPVEVLAHAWVDDAEVIYIGKAGASRGRGLRKRLDEYRRHGLGGRARHWGGRFIWQLADADTLLVAWKPTPHDEPGIVEAQLIADFTARTGRRPFANRNRGSLKTLSSPTDVPLTPMR
ncbi:MAG: hypothetical protein LWW77_00330 [Propionibacteriales bacterium]|nr:hypothetical protein [Propionibacteriales bacterium]